MSFECIVPQSFAVATNRNSKEMAMKNLRLLLLLTLAHNNLGAQKIDNTASFRDIKSDRYFRLHLDNDYFSSSDKDYTGGYHFEWVSPLFQKNPANHLFFKPEGSEFKYGLSFEQNVFTPERITSFEIQRNDRPFASVVLLKSFAVATDTIRHSRFISSLSIGWLGPATCGKEMQSGIHEAIGYANRPNGWCNQIKNDIVLNCEISVEKQLIRYRNLFSLNANGTSRLGTLYTNVGFGLNGAIGIINSPFTPVKNKNGFRLYVFSQPFVNAIGYDATLQGGIFDRNSPYTIASRSISRFTAQHNYGVVLQTNALYFEYFRTAITREFNYGKSSKWGGVKIGFKI